MRLGYNNQMEACSYVTITTPLIHNSTIIAILQSFDRTQLPLLVLGHKTRSRRAVVGKFENRHLLYAVSSKCTMQKNKVGLVGMAL